MSKKQFSQEQKLKILESAEKLGVRPAADIAGIHYTTVYEWRNQLKAMEKKAFVEYQPAIPGRGIKQITPRQEQAVLKIWRDNAGFGPGQVRNQLRRQGITISIRTVRRIMQLTRSAGRP